MKTDRRGRFFRNVGRTKTGSQHKFYFGKDHAKAIVAAAALDRVWKATQERYIREHSQQFWQHLDRNPWLGPPDLDPVRPVWDANTLAVANAVAEERPAIVTAPADATADQRV